ncbi:MULTISPECIES: procyclic acidic repetitive family protein [Collinsella]|uniref:procyclic acidic repetitive family protein n=1 Tax=Collinsella TaxID=102106 RepID=UPI001C24E9FE|nr:MULTISPECIES: procyclic acidic repetitive family protein [Collinsella]MBU9000254.1 procyclic acidic repetitive family protein [Collinsella aerofaciens]MBU9062649.1 procyclic acidic repetitive family protein [Collinsella sp. MSK.8.10]MCB5365399.1 procyclic acidic repetitive family protein [Collinsella aerofaciens]MCB5367768.1 procyclic acidic repetitive family protein [Collinsella aerofaciens]
MQKAFPIFAMELFCDGWLFLEHSDVTWDGSSHALKRVRINADKSLWLLSHTREHFNDVPSNIDLCQYVGTTLEELEKHAEPVVPRDVVSPRLQLLFEGDLTPITLVQLMCVGDWLSVRQGNEGEIRVTYDERLAQQISGFGLFMASFVESLCSQSTMLSDGSVATVFEARPATEPGICAFLEMDDAVSAEPEPEDALGVEREPEPALEATPEPSPEVSPEQVSETAPELEPDIEPESELEPGPASEPVPEPSAKEQEKQRIAREVKAARDKMELLDKVRGKLLNRLLVLRREYPDLSNQSGSNQIKELSAQVDWLDDQLRDARLAYAKTSHASIQALKELGQ